MNLQFSIKPSKYFTCWLMLMTFLTITTIWQFAVVVWVKIAVIGIVSLWFIHEVIKAQASSTVILFDAQSKRWKVSVDGGRFLEINTLVPIYLTSRLVWLKVDLHTHFSRNILVFADALPKEKFLQFRRCILSS